MAFFLSPSHPIPFFTPATPLPRPSTSIGLSRWNNANAQPFLAPLRRQHQIESDLRLQRRLDCATTLLSDDATPPNPSPPRFRSKGTPSTTASSPSIPSKVSKYSKPSLDYDFSHPAFRPSRAHPPAQPDADRSAVLSEDGVSYKLENAPFEFRYSYTETPNALPIALREPPYVPFGPKTMPRPWTGRAPLPKSRRKLPEFDSFRPPPPGKKGVKPVQAPGPFLAGSGPRHAMTREEVMGDPLTDEEVAEMVKGCMKTTRQLNMGRDGLTHNMLDNIHAHWKRRRVCKIKCKGVCTVDMDNVRCQLEEKTGGSVIYTRGGVIFLFRGRNYNYKTRPRFPLMLWKPVPPVYPRLVQRAPEGLTLEEATEMRKIGRTLPPICKLAKNGVYVKLAKDVKEAFELCELVRIDCKGLHKSDTRKIGAKLKDLVPCVLISFEYEHILMWRGKDWKSSLAPSKNLPSTSLHRVTDVSSSSLYSTDSLSGGHEILEELDKMIDSEITLHENGSCSDNDDDNIISNGEGSGDEFSDQWENKPFTSNDLNDDAVKLVDRCRFEAGDSIDERLLIDNACNLIEDKSRVNGYGCAEVMMEVELSDLGRNSSFQDSSISIPRGNDNITPTLSSTFDLGSGNIETEPTVDCGQTGKNQSNHRMDGLLRLLKQAVESGCAVLLDDVAIDANIVYGKAVSLAKIAPPGPVFKHESKESIKRRPEYRRSQKNGNQDEAARSASDAIVKRSSRKGAMNSRKTDLGNCVPDVVPHGSLRVDELAKLLA